MSSSASVSNRRPAVVELLVVGRPGPLGGTWKAAARRLADDKSFVPHELELVAHCPLGDERWLLVLGAPGALYAAPVVQDGDELRRAVPGDGAAAALVGLLTGAAVPSRAGFDWQRLSRGMPWSTGVMPWSTENDPSRSTRPTSRSWSVSGPS